MKLTNYIISKTPRAPVTDKLSKNTTYCKCWRKLNLPTELVNSNQIQPILSVNKSRYYSLLHYRTSSWSDSLSFSRVGKKCLLNFIKNWPLMYHLSMSTTTLLNLKTALTFYFTTVTKLSLNRLISTHKQHLPSNKYFFFQLNLVYL